MFYIIYYMKVRLRERLVKCWRNRELCFRICSGFRLAIMLFRCLVTSNNESGREKRIMLEELCQDGQST